METQTKKIITLGVIVLLLAVVAGATISLLPIKETIDYKAYYTEVSVKDAVGIKTLDAVKLEIKPKREMTAEEVITEFIKIENEKK